MGTLIVSHGYSRWIPQHGRFQTLLQVIDREEGWHQLEQQPCSSRERNGRSSWGSQQSARNHVVKRAPTARWLSASAQGGLAAPPAMAVVEAPPPPEPKTGLQRRRLRLRCSALRAAAAPRHPRRGGRAGATAAAAAVAAGWPGPRRRRRSRLRRRGRRCCHRGAAAAAVGRRRGCCRRQGGERAPTRASAGVQWAAGKSEKGKKAEGGTLALLRAQLKNILRSSDRFPPSTQHQWAAGTIPPPRSQCDDSADGGAGGRGCPRLVHADPGVAKSGHGHVHRLGTLSADTVRHNRTQQDTTGTTDTLSDN